jgi:hypothetical protein
LRQVQKSSFFNTSFLRRHSHILEHFKFNKNTTAIINAFLRRCAGHALGASVLCLRATHKRAETYGFSVAARPRGIVKGVRVNTLNEKVFYCFREKENWKKSNIIKKGVIYEL